MICRFNVVFAALLAVLSWAPMPAWAQEGVQGQGFVQVDTALVVSVDVSNSVDENRYRLQMEGIAAALEDPGVIEAITNGPNGGILFSMVTWADRPEFVLPWVKIASKEDAQTVAAKIRKLPQAGGEFTCMTRMMRSVNDKIVSQIPGEATRIVLDVSGDGPDNCNAEEAITDVRDELVANGVTVNGLPINIGDPGEPVGEGAYRAPGSSFDASQLKQNSQGPTTLEDWYRNNVMGGMGAFVLPANGYSDFGRAIRQKFVIEISGLGLPAARNFGAVETHKTAK